MKKTNFLLTVLFGLALLSFSSVDQSDKTKLTGTWSIESVNLDPDPIDLLKAKGASQEEIEMTMMIFEKTLAPIKENTKIILNADETYKATSYDITTGSPIQDEGTWSINEDKSIFTTVSNEGLKKDASITIVSSNKFIITETSDPKMTIKMTFVKN